MRGLFPWFFAHHQEHEVGEGAFRRCLLADVLDLGGWGGREESLLPEGDIGIVLLGLDMAAVAWVRRYVQMSRKE